MVVQAMQLSQIPVFLLILVKVLVRLNGSHLNKGGKKVRTQIIYDETGYVLSVRQGEPEPREPIGVPFLWVEIPQGKRLSITDGIGIDVSASPHQAILEDIPPSEAEALREELTTTQAALADLTEMIIGGM